MSGSLRDVAASEAAMHCADGPASADAVRAAWRIDGLDCPDCARSVSAAVERIPGVGCAELNFASATLLVDFDPSIVPVADIVDTVTAAGYGAAPLDERARAAAGSERRWIDRNLTEVATIGSGAFTVLGLFASWIGAPEVAAVALFAVAIVFGGLLVWRRAWLSLKARTLDMNVLMTIAVFGAVLLGEWGEAATVYFLFSLGGLLEARSLERTRRSIRDLMSLAPNTVRVVRDGATLEICG